MKSVMQIVKKARLFVNDELISEIGNGLIVFLGVATGDDFSDADYHIKKISNLRVFVDENGKMNKSVTDLGYEVLLVSQFTLCGDVSHGNRPDFISAERPERAKELYEYVAKRLLQGGLSVKTGVFGAHMEIEQFSCGPVTIIC